MPRSMTGYGRAQRLEDGRDVLVEIRAVNHRYYEFSARMPRACLYLEEKLKSFLNGRIGRGKVEVSVTITRPDGKDAQIAVNRSVAEGYVNALRTLNQELGENGGLWMNDDLTLSSLLRLPDVFTVTKEQDDENAVWAVVSAAATEALDSFVNMRQAEGERLAADLSNKLDGLEVMLRQVETIEPGVAESYRQRLYSKLTELLADTNIDEQRILTETAIFAEKTAIDEETVRLHSHIAQFRTLLQAEEPIGRKLDFLVQEMNREVNTIGSKAQDLSITRLVVDMKSEIEKIREQIQNIE
ncbi:MAG: YicC family protein [Oscillospiraceae bacterium]|nr:YicC family protein [Oscillospiraceae bacterium]